ncbi:MAG: gliding motility-associated C-terminal domain-containing protein, partial [Bacteroidia bacterium]|nr:gliding motility-associated C-terminal domain-containing protein [Bacteroidia bacterium]
GEVYQFKISGDIKDFAGNMMQNGNYSFGLPEPPGPGDIMFNELLFNPLPGDPDYIELYNCSEKVIDASRLQLVSVNDGMGDTSQISPVSGEKRCIMPGTYYALTTDRKRISDRYFSTDPEYLFEEGSLPSMADDQGHLILYNRELDRIDEVFYNNDMHYSLLTVYEGVALEKTMPRNRSEEAINWHSASESSGWGTPGAPNSVFIELAAASDKVVFSSSKITPDNDGNEDILVIRLSMAGNGNVVSVMIFDETGNYIRKVATNVLAGPETSLIWDGTADDGSPVDTGIYIVFITLYDNTGKTDKWKKVCTVIRN